MTAVRHLIVEGSSSSVDNGGAGTMSYHTSAGLPQMLERQSYVIVAFKDGLNILLQGGQNDLLSIDPSVWLTDFSAYLATFRAAIASSGKLVRLGVSTHDPPNDVTFIELLRM